MSVFDEGELVLYRYKKRVSGLSLRPSLQNLYNSWGSTRDRLGRIEVTCGDQTRRVIGCIQFLQGGTRLSIKQGMGTVNMKSVDLSCLEEFDGKRVKITIHRVN